MLNFNTIDSVNSFVHPIPLHGAHFGEMQNSMVTSSPSIHTQQINLNYLSANTNDDQTNWTESVHNTSSSNLDENCNRNNDLPNPNEGIREQKVYLQTVINNDEADGRTALNMDNYLQPKGSENVKRFSVNNLLQLANNCRALVDEHRISSGKSHSKFIQVFSEHNCSDLRR